MFSSLDPLRVKLTSDNVAANNAMRREIANILGSYVGWFDPFAEAIQNALDSVEEKESKEEQGYAPTVWVTIDLKDGQRRRAGRAKI